MLVFTRLLVKNVRWRHWLIVGGRKRKRILVQRCLFLRRPHNFIHPIILVFISTTSHQPLLLILLIRLIRLIRLVRLILLVSNSNTITINIIIVVHLYKSSFTSFLLIIKMSYTFLLFFIFLRTSCCLRNRLNRLQKLF